MTKIAANTIALNAKQAAIRASKMEKKAAAVLAQLWPDVPSEKLWNRKAAAGFTTIPRTLPYVANIIDSLTKGKPAGFAYLTLWARTFHVGIVELGSEGTMAFESGFTGERAIDSWRKRMRSLQELGFIDFRPGPEHEYQWVLIWNPHLAVARLGDRVQPRHRTALLQRLHEIGAKDASFMETSQ